MAEENTYYPGLHLSISGDHVGIHMMAGGYARVPPKLPVGVQQVHGLHLIVFSGFLIQHVVSLPAFDFHQAKVFEQQQRLVAAVIKNIPHLVVICNTLNEVTNTQEFSDVASGFQRQ